MYCQIGSARLEIDPFCGLGWESLLPIIGSGNFEVDLPLTWLANITNSGTLDVFEQEASTIYQDTGTISLTVLVPDLQTPLPPTLLLFTSGLATLGLLGWRRKRKAQESNQLLQGRSHSR
jgi:hypothetical protein